MYFHFMKSCFSNNLVSFKHFKVKKLNLHYQGKCETELRNFFSLIFQWLQHVICLFWSHQRSLEAGSGTLVLKKSKERPQYFN